MTISSEIRKAGPFAGTGLVSVYPFSFKVFKAGDLLVVRTDANGVDSTLILNSDYSVTLNPNQNVVPGGTINLSVALPVGFKLTATSQVPQLQPVDLTNNGGFFPSVINAALDRLTILVQQLSERVGRSLKFPISDNGNNSELPNATQRANSILGFDSLGNPTVLVPSSGSAADVLIQLAKPTGAGLIGFVQSGGGSVLRTIQSRLSETVSVKDFGAIGDGSNADDAFELAAKYRAGIVVVPAGNYLITKKTTTPALWELQKGAVISGLPNAGTAGGGVPDTSRLTGALISSASGGVCNMKIGSTDPWLAKGIRDTVDYLAEFASVSSKGAVGGMFATRSSDNPTPNMQTIALEAISYNDNIINPEPSWSIYTETVRAVGAGPAFGAEMDFVNLGSTNNLTPYSAVDPYSSLAAPTAALWLSCGGGNSELSVGANNISAAIVTLPNTKKFNIGWVVRDGSIESANIILAPQYYKYAWNGAGDRNLSSLDDRQHFRAVYSDTQALAVADINRKYKANGASATTASDVIFNSSYQGYTGAGPQEGAGHYVAQRTNYSSGSAGFIQVFSAANLAGGVSDVGINVGIDGVFCPATSDNSLALGSPAHRWSVVYAGTGAINTSDVREKQQISNLSEKEKVVAIGLKKLIKRFKFNDAVKEKSICARWHFGVMAQEVIEEFNAAGLNPFEYAIVCHDKWEAEPEILDDEGNVKTKATKAGERFGIRYDELICFIISTM